MHQLKRPVVAILIDHGAGRVGPVRPPVAPRRLRVRRGLLPEGRLHPARAGPTSTAGSLERRAATGANASGTSVRGSTRRSASGRSRSGSRRSGWTPSAGASSSALAGTLAVTLAAIMAQLLFAGGRRGPTCAGVLLATEHLNVVMSRTALLDVHLELWVVAALLFLLLDRRWLDRRQAALDERAAWRTARRGPVEAARSTPRCGDPGGSRRRRASARRSR